MPPAGLRKAGGLPGLPGSAEELAAGLQALSAQDAARQGPARQKADGGKTEGQDAEGRNSDGQNSDHRKTDGQNSDGRKADGQNSDSQRKPADPGPDATSPSNLPAGFGRFRRGKRGDR